jgi:hypothetical protein
MKTLDRMKLAGAMFACTLALAPQAEAAQEPVPLRKVTDVQEFDATGWRSKLTQADLDARERALDEFTALARRDERARAALDGWSKDRTNLELAWTSRLTLRALDRFPGRLRARLADPEGHWDSLREEIERLTAHLGDVQLQLDDLFVPPALRGRPEDAGFGGVGKSFSLQVDPDGVKCKVIDEVDGERVEREYEAQSIDELTAAHPELREYLRGGMGRGLGLGGMPELFRRGPRTDVLGILCTPLPAERQKALGLAAEGGLLVERAVRGTLAHALGIQAGDALLELNGVDIKSADDVGRVLRERSPDAVIEAVVATSSGERRTLTWRPPTAPAPKAGAQGTTLR